MTAGPRFLCPSHVQDEIAEERQSAVRDLVLAGAGVRDWLLGIAAPEERFLAVCLHFGSELKKSAYDYAPLQVEWSAAEVMPYAFPELVGGSISAFFTPVFGTDETESLPIAPQRLESWFFNRRSRDNAPIAANRTPSARMTVFDCRNMARRANLDPPPVALLERWKVASTNAARLHQPDRSFGTTISDLLRSHPMPAPDVRSGRVGAVSDAEVELTADQRIEAALRELRRRNVRPTPRVVPGKHHRPLRSKLFGLIGQDVDIEVEPAFPVGRCTWCEPVPHGTDSCQDFETGVTPSRRIVPMPVATAGDDVEDGYASWVRAKGMDLVEGISLHPEQVVIALEALVNRGND